MNVKQLYVNSVEINGALIEVPADFNYVTIDMNGSMCAWVIKPYLCDGYWVGDFAISLGKVELKQGDQWCSVFEIEDKS